MYSIGVDMRYAGSGVVTRQGQITVPKVIRDSNGIDIGTIMEFYYNDDIIIVKQKRMPLDVFESLSAKTRERFERRGITEEDVESEIQSSRSGRSGG